MLTPATLARLAGYTHHLPSARDLVTQTSDGTAELPWQAVEVYDAVPDLLALAVRQAQEIEAARVIFVELAARTEPIAAAVADHEREIRRALRLPPDAPWPDVLARAEHLAGHLAEEVDGV